MRGRLYAILFLLPSCHVNIILIKIARQIPGQVCKEMQNILYVLHHVEWFNKK